MLKHVTPLGTTVKERESPPSGHKNKANRRRQQPFFYGEGQNEILELSPLARFMSRFRRNNCSHHMSGDAFIFSLEAWGDEYNTRLSGHIKMQHRTWSASWDIIANHQHPLSKNGIAPLMKQFLEITGAQSKENKKSFYSLTLSGSEGVETLFHLDKEVLEVLTFLLMQVVVFASLPNPAVNSSRQRIFYEAGNDYQVLRDKCTFYFPWSGIQELKITLQH